ncbi:MAG TPA: NUDIX domain-containing protein [Thermoanaerobaculia bacterium]
MKRDELLDALAVYAAEDPAEAKALARIRRFLASRADPFSRKDPEGHVTGSAIVARPDGSAFLLVHHRKLGCWLQPGGHSEEKDRSVFDTALREAREETGIADFRAPLSRSIFDVDVHAIPAHGKDPAHTHFDIRYLLTSSAATHSAGAEDPARPMVWLALPRALEAGLDGSLSRALRKAHVRLTAMAAGTWGQVCEL